MSVSNKIVMCPIVVCFQHVTWLYVGNNKIQQDRRKMERGRKKNPQNKWSWGLTKGGSDSPFIRQKIEEVCNGCINRICANDRKGNITHRKSYLARKQLFTQCLIQLLKSSSLPCYLRGRRRKEAYILNRNRNRVCMELEQKQSMCVYVCMHGELFANFTEKDHQLAHQLRGVTALKATLSLWGWSLT